MRRSVVSILVVLFAFSAFVLGSPSSGRTQDEPASPEPIEGVTWNFVGAAVDDSPDGVSLAVVDVSMDQGAELPFSADIHKAVVEVISGTVTVEIGEGEGGQTYYQHNEEKIFLNPGDSAVLTEGDVLSSRGVELLFINQPGDVAGLTEGGVLSSNEAEHSFTNQQGEPAELRASLDVLTAGRCFICPVPRP